MIETQFKYAMGGLFIIALVYTINRPAGLTLAIIALMAMALNARRKGLL